MRKITEIYTEYKIPPQLTAHMLRVAAITSVVYDNLNEPLDKEDVVTACLLHDMGNIIKFDLSYFPEFLEPEGPEFWQKIKDEYIEKYGKDEHKASLKILKELGLPENIINIVDNIAFPLACCHCHGSNLIYKIVNYADWRVDLHGVKSYEDRMEEGRKRYQDRVDNNLKEEERNKLVACGKEIEKQIFAKCKIKPEDINDKTVKPIIESLKDFMIP